MRILYVHNINSVATDYARCLTCLGHSTAVYEPDLRGGLMPLPMKLVYMPQRILDMRHIIDKLKPRYFDIVHIHWASYGVLGLVSRLPYIVHCHGEDVLRPTFRPILTSIFRRAAIVLCITPDLMSHVQSIRPDAIFFPAPIDTNRFKPLENTQSQPPRPWTILLFARLDAKKGPEVATQGIARFAQRHPDVQVKLLDWGLLKEKFKQRYGDRFEFIPCVVPELVHHLILSADVVVGQFSLGVLGLSELQAMSCAKPVICAFRYDEAYPTSPPLCRATTAEEIDEHLENLFQHPEVGTMLGQKSRAWVIENHDPDKLTVRPATPYRSIVR